MSKQGFGPQNDPAPISLPEKPRREGSQLGQKKSAAPRPRATKVAKEGRQQCEAQSRGDRLTHKNGKKTHVVCPWLEPTKWLWCPFGFLPLKPTTNKMVSPQNCGYESQGAPQSPGRKETSRMNPHCNLRKRQIQCWRPCWCIELY